MLDVSMILGKWEIKENVKCDKPVKHLETDLELEKRRARGEKVFSYRTERDYTQAVGKLFTGEVDDGIQMKLKK